MPPRSDDGVSGREVLDALATVAHELRTPLSAVVGWASLLRSTKELDPELLARGLETIDRNARAQDLRLLVLQALDTIGPIAAHDRRRCGA